MVSTFTCMVESMPIIICRQAARVSYASNTGSLSSCMSLLYASGSPFITVRRPIRWPYTRPVLPRISSAMSGFFFCGIILLPVA